MTTSAFTLQRQIELDELTCRTLLYMAKQWGNGLHPRGRMEEQAVRDLVEAIRVGLRQ